MSTLTATTKEIESQIRQLEDRLQDLKQKVESQHEEGEGVVEHLGEPRSFAQLLTATGLSDRELIHQLHALLKSGKVERWDLPRWVRSDLPSRDKLRFVCTETPLRQNEIEALSGMRRGQVSGQLTELQAEGLVRLGDSKGDPWFMVPDAPAPARDTRSRPRRQRRVRAAQERPTQRTRGRKADS